MDEILLKVLLKIAPECLQHRPRERVDVIKRDLCSQLKVNGAVITARGKQDVHILLIKHV